MADNFRFAESDSLLCYHGPMLYEAKCLKRRKAIDGSNRAQYFIHYKGWNSKWEEWVDDDLVLAVNAVNLNKMAYLKELHSNTKKRRGKRSITAIKKEPIGITTPPVKETKHKHSEMSLESIQLVNVPSPTDLKQKIIGRPSKTLMTIPKNKSLETNEENTVLDKVEEIKTDLVIDTDKETEAVIETETIKEIEKVRAIIEIVGASETEEIEITKTVKVTQEVDKTEAIEGTNTAEGSQPIEENTPDVFTVSAPVVTTIGVIEVPRILKQRIVYDHLMITEHNKMLKFENKITISTLIHGYIRSTSGLKLKDRERACGIGLTLIQYFNSLIHSKLIYDVERKNKIIEKAKNCLQKRIEDGVITKNHLIPILYPKKLWHYVYGPTYLLRLFVNLPQHLLTGQYTEKYFDIVIKNFEHFLKYVENNYEKYFPENETVYNYEYI